jgi:hypothetical protein
VKGDDGSVFRMFRQMKENENKRENERTTTLHLKAFKRLIVQVNACYDFMSFFC